MPLSKEQWLEIEKSLGYQFGKVKLMCDGYEITARVESSRMKLYIMIYIDGLFKIEWADGKDDRCIKFYKKSIKYFSSAKVRKAALKPSRLRYLSKEDREHFKESVEKKFEYFVPYWTNPKALCRHIRKTCTDIEFIE